jgi:hypothetical protein
MLHMLYLLQVFRKHVASVCSKYFICLQRMLQSFFIWMLHHVSHIHYSSMFQLFQSYIAANGFMLQVAILDISCVSHTCCKCTFQMFHLCLDVCSIQIFFMLKCFMLFDRRRAEGERTGRAVGPANEGAAVGVCSSSAGS